MLPYTNRIPGSFCDKQIYGYRRLSTSIPRIYLLLLPTNRFVRLNLRSFARLLARSANRFALTDFCAGFNYVWRLFIRGAGLNTRTRTCLCDLIARIGPKREISAMALYEEREKLLSRRFYWYDDLNSCLIGSVN